MPKVSIYLPDELYAEVRRQELSISVLAQQACRDALAANANREWIERSRLRRPRTTAKVDTAAILDTVREEFGA